MTSGTDLCNEATAARNEARRIAGRPAEMACAGGDETYDERCSRIDTELGRPAMSWRDLAIALLGLLLAWIGLALLLKGCM